MMRKMCAAHALTIIGTVDKCNLFISLYNTQVSGTELDHVPGGYNSGSLAYSGSFEVCLGREGQFDFVRFVQFF